mmetsp:Transcript_5074/g.13883  ORF Transcript_5074/g.13883 Transcript_5074/m.13883 type:complete len:118 (+) Transcript_5074:1088-1441(+)
MMDEEGKERKKEREREEGGRERLDRPPLLMLVARGQLALTSIKTQPHGAPKLLPLACHVCALPPWAGQRHLSLSARRFGYPTREAIPQADRKTPELLPSSVRQPGKEGGTGQEGSKA